MYRPSLLFCPLKHRETFIKNREKLEHLVADLRESYGRGQSSLKQLVSAGNDDDNEQDGAPRNSWNKSSDFHSGVHLTKVLSHEKKESPVIEPIAFADPDSAIVAVKDTAS